MLASELVQKGFRLAGSWRDEHDRPDRAEWLKHQPGLYAFAIAGEVVFIGKSGFLDRKLRDYGAWAFKFSRHDTEDVYFQIAASVLSGKEVQVFTKIMRISMAELTPIEAELIHSAQPLWNRTCRAALRRQGHYF